MLYQYRPVCPGSLESALAAGTKRLSLNRAASSLRGAKGGEAIRQRSTSAAHLHRHRVVDGPQKAGRSTAHFINASCRSRRCCSPRNLLTIVSISRVGDRKRVVLGKGLSVRFAPGGR